MDKLLQGILDFQKKLQPSYRETFAQLALGQSPDALFIGCSDSRVAVNVFASTNPGDLFVVRNVGNMVPPCGSEGVSSSDESEAAAIEFALMNLKVRDIIVCGHSECGAMQALVKGRNKVVYPHLKSWLRHGEISLIKLGAKNPHLSRHNELSQWNVLQQIDHLKTYPIVHERMSKGNLRLHGWWFDLKAADVYAFDDQKNGFILFNEELAKKMASRS